MKKSIYQCLGCKEKNTIYPSYWPPTHNKAIMTCYKCGENEESAKGVSKNGVRINVFHQASFKYDFDDDNHKKKKPLNEFKRRAPKNKSKEGINKWLADVENQKPTRIVHIAAQDI